MKLKTYAPGDGSLTLIWVRDDGLVSDRPVTWDAAERFLASEDGKHLGEKGWKPFPRGDEMRLIAPISRIDEKTLEVNGEAMHYETIREPDGHIYDQGLRLSHGMRQVVNWSTRDSVRFFLMVVEPSRK